MRTKSVLATYCNDSTVAVALRATRTLPAGKRLQSEASALHGNLSRRNIDPFGVSSSA
jgi:hypothetical protein